MKLFYKKLGSGKHFTSPGGLIVGCGFKFGYGDSHGDGFGNGLYRISGALSEGGAGHSYGFKDGSGQGENFISLHKYDQSYPYELLTFNL